MKKKIVGSACVGLGVASALCLTAPVSVLASEEPPSLEAQCAAEADESTLASDDEEAAYISDESPDAVVQDVVVEETATDDANPGFEEAAADATDEVEPSDEEEAPEQETPVEEAEDTAAPDATSDAASEPALEESSSADVSDQSGVSATEDMTSADAPAASEEEAEVAEASAQTYKEEWVKGDDGSYRWYDSEGLLKTNGWVITTKHVDGTSGAGERYWIEAETNALAFSKLLNIVEGASSYWAYATDKGYVLRGKLDTGAGRVYVADNDGRLLDAEKDAWVVTDKYDGSMQRYRVSAADHAAISGDFTVDGKNYYGIGGQGYVYRGAGTVGGAMRYANNEGVLTDGWVITDAFGQGTQRYWQQDGKVVSSALIQTGANSWAYARPEGYVVRGKYTASNGYVYLANNDGLLESTGWLVSDAYGDGLQRYLIDADAHACIPGYSTDGWSHLTLAEGYVLRGKKDNGAGRVYVADNDGRLADYATDRWVVTDVYDGTLRRYRFSAADHAMVAGWFSVGKDHYFGLGGKGYVVTNGPSSTFATADGVLLVNGWLVTDAFGQGLRRYFFDNCQVTTGLISASKAGYWAYGRSEGFVVTGKYAVSGLEVYLANGEGKLEDPGWLVTSAYDGTPQRYYIDSQTHACKIGSFNVGSEYYFGIPTQGYVLRGTRDFNGSTYRANNDGVLTIVFKSAVDTSKKTKASVATTFVGEAQYLFLPAHADLSSVTLEFAAPNGQYGYFSLDGKQYSKVGSGSSFNLSGSVVKSSIRQLWFKTGESSTVQTLNVMISSNVRAMYLVSDDPANYGRAYIEGSSDHSTQATGSMLLVDPDGTVVYNGGLSQIKGRGNSTWRFDKKPYQIKLDKKTDLLETGNKDNKNKTWVLISNPYDHSYVRNSVAYTLAQQMGVASAIEYAPIDLYYDGEYRGSYLLTEKVQINSGRVDIQDLEDMNSDVNGDASYTIVQGTNSYGNPIKYAVGVKNPSDITGGYLMEFDTGYFSDEDGWFSIWNGSRYLYFVSKSPEVWSYEEANYMSCLLQDAFDAMRNGGVNPRTGRSTSSYVDIDSLASLYWMCELTLNRDAFNWSSTYLYKDSDASGNSKITFGPAWDYDITLGNTEMVAHAYEMDPEGWWTRSSTELGYIFMKDPAVVSAIESKKASAIKLCRDYINGDQFKSYMSSVQDSFAMDTVIWHNVTESASYIRDWFNRRLNWIEAH